MNVFGQRERSWRKARKRAVSPIIATILLVAITVVLAAVLYVLITGLTHGPGSTPIGSAFTAGNPISGTVTATAATPCATGLAATSTVAGMAGAAGTYYEYTLTIESSTITLTSALFEVKTSAGAVAPVAGGFYIVNINNNVVACSNGLTALAMSSTVTVNTASTTGCNGAACTTSTPLTSIYTIVIVGTGWTTSPTGTGLTFVAVGTGSYSGTTGALSLP